MQKANIWENILITIGRAQSASSNDETRLIASHLNQLFEERLDQINTECDAIVDELNREILVLRESVVEC